HVRKLPDYLWIAEIAPQDDLGHLQMRFDDEHDLFSLVCRHLEFFENDFHTLGARVDVISFIVPMRLPDVVKEERQQQQFGILQFIQQNGEMMRGRKLFDVPDRNQRVLVDGVFVKKVADDAASYFLKIRKYPAKQSDLMHR